MLRKRYDETPNNLQGGGLGIKKVWELYGRHKAQLRKDEMTEESYFRFLEEARVVLPKECIEDDIEEHMAICEFIKWLLEKRDAKFREGS